MVFESDGARLHYEVVGEGEPLLWVHGFMGSGADWSYIFNEPPAGFRLIAPDLRGHGASFDPARDVASPFSFRQAARDILALLSHLQIDRVKAIGLSGGGITLLHMATADPKRIAAMVLVSSETELDAMRKRHVHGDPQLQQLLASARAFADSYDDVNFTPPYLGTITADTLIVFGDRDPLYPVSIAFELHAAIPRSHLWVVPDGGHGPVFGDQAPRFAETALSFLSGAWR